MANRKKNCPWCGIAIPPEAIRTWRPFSCPRCSGIVAPRSVYRPLAGIGCLTTLLLFVAIGWILSHHWMGVIAGSLAGIVAGFIVGNLVYRLSNRLRPSPPLLARHIIRDDPKLFPQFASLLESFAAAEAWGYSMESVLSSLREQISLDDSLIGAAVDAAQQFKNLLSGTNTHCVEAALQQFQLDELRVELGAIARDLRIAAK